MHVVARVAPGRRQESIRSLEEHTIPWIKQTPGFIRGTWFGDDHTGHGVVLFASEGEARRTAGMVAAGPNDPVEIESVTVFEVTAQA